MSPKEVRLQKRFAILSAVALLAGSAATAQAQAGIGVIGGVSQATFTGGGSQGITWRTTFLAGLVGILPLGEDLAIRPELHFATKGAQARLGRTADAALDLTYLEIPLLLQVRPGSADLLRPQLYGGMSVGALLGCRREEADCEDDPDFVGHDFDTSIIVGGEVEVFGAGVGMRYEAGLTRVKADQEGLEILNGVMSFTVRYILPR
ncbi:MAG: PorT family protein [Gemmatimonadetes bacterium]|nr:PorT family protein [Gemmatimonadota bacterium]MYH53603.1 PorT family protein [Gemmatimonadota bacterium]MYK67363.1 PorT family protein [Gemmatimonadota bacterium]